MLLLLFLYASTCSVLDNMYEAQTAAALSLQCGNTAVCNIDLLTGLCVLKRVSAFSLIARFTGLEILYLPHLVQIDGYASIDNNALLKKIYLPSLNNVNTAIPLPATALLISSDTNPMLECVLLNTTGLIVEGSPCMYPMDTECQICQDSPAGCNITIDDKLCFLDATTTMIPTSYPTNFPTMMATKTPTIIPTLHPTIQPSIYPTLYPTPIPTTTPTDTPTTIPSTQAPTPSTIINQPNQTIPAVINGNLQVIPNSVAQLSNVTVSGSVSIGANVTAVFVVAEKPINPIVIQLIAADSIMGQFSAYQASIPDLNACERVVYQPQQSATTLAVGISIDDSACVQTFPVWGYALIGLVGAFLVAGLFGALLLWRRRRYIAQVKKDFQTIREQQLVEDMEELKKQYK